MGISGGKLKIGSRRITTPIHVLRGIIKKRAAPQLHKSES